RNAYFFSDGFQVIASQDRRTGDLPSGEAIKRLLGSEIFWRTRSSVSMDIRPFESPMYLVGLPPCADDFAPGSSLSIISGPRSDPLTRRTYHGVSQVKVVPTQGAYLRYAQSRADCKYGYFTFRIFQHV